MRSYDLPKVIWPVKQSRRDASMSQGAVKQSQKLETMQPLPDSTTSNLFISSCTCFIEFKFRNIFAVTVNCIFKLHFLFILILEMKSIFV